MIKRFMRQMKERESQKVFAALLGGKLIGIGAVFMAAKGLMSYFGAEAGAATGIHAVAAKADDLINPLNTDRKSVV